LDSTPYTNEKKENRKKNKTEKEAKEWLTKIWEWWSRWGRQMADGQNGPPYIQANFVLLARMAILWLLVNCLRQDRLFNFIQWNSSDTTRRKWRKNTETMETLALRCRLLNIKMQTWNKCRATLFP
jgi:hypothetical protein